METAIACAPASRQCGSMQWIERLLDGSVVRVRPIACTDSRREYAFLSHLSPELRTYRFLGLTQKASEDVARELACSTDPDDVTLIGLIGDEGSDTEVGAAFYRMRANHEHCDCAVIVDPDWQQRGIGMILMQHLIEVARARGISRMYAADAARCAGEHSLPERLGFHACPDPEDPAVMTFELELR